MRNRKVAAGGTGGGVLCPGRECELPAWQVEHNPHDTQQPSHTRPSLSGNGSGPSCALPAELNRSIRLEWLSNSRQGTLSPGRPFLRDCGKYTSAGGWEQLHYCLYGASLYTEATHPSLLIPPKTHLQELCAASTLQLAPPGEGGAADEQRMCGVVHAHHRQLAGWLDMPWWVREGCQLCSCTCMRGQPTQFLVHPTPTPCAQGPQCVCAFRTSTPGWRVFPRALR